MSSDEEEGVSSEQEYQSNDDNDVRIEDTLSVEEENKEDADSNDGNEMKRRRVTFAPDTFTSSSSLVINKKIQGLINRLNESNIQSIFKSMEELYKENSKRGTLLLLCYKINAVEICALKLIQLIYKHFKDNLYFAEIFLIIIFCSFQK